MLALQKSKAHQGKCTPNVLPCRVNHSGPVDVSRRYWDPRAREGKTTSYFRGRKLYARRLRVPAGYRGVVAVGTERVVLREKAEEEGEEGEGGEAEIETKALEEVGTFEAVEVWGHEMLVDEGDPYVRGVEEWIGFAEAIHEVERKDEEKK